MSNLQFSSREIEERVEAWSSGKYGESMAQEVEALREAGDVKELEDRFYKTLEFGTGGLRGVMGAGTNRMNPVIVSQATQGLANYVKANATRPMPLRAVITHDTRNNSRTFAEAAATVLAGNGFEVFLSPEIRPTPWLSYAIRALECHTGIMLSASHNPKE